MLTLVVVCVAAVATTWFFHSREMKKFIRGEMTLSQSLRRWKIFMLVVTVLVCAILAFAVA